MHIPERALSENEFRQTLESHHAWLDTAGIMGERADFSDMDLRNHSLEGIRLQHTKLCHAHMDGMDLKETDLEGVDLSCADLSGCSFRGTRLHGAVMDNCILEGADLSEAKGLKTGQLRGCILNQAILPAHYDLDGRLEAARVRANATHSLFLSILVITLYSWLTIGSASDLDLILDNSSKTLPIIDVSLSIVTFFYLAPIILTFLSVYLQLELHNLWAIAVELPGILPDGSPLHKKIDSLHVNSLLERNLYWLKQNTGWEVRFKAFVGLFIMQGIIPLTLVLFWMAFLVRHEVFGSVLHIILTGISMSLAFYFSLSTVATLQLTSISSVWRRHMLKMLVFPLVLGVMATLSYVVITGKVTHPKYLAADLKNTDLSIKPGGWKDDMRNQQASSVRGAHLSELNLRFANLQKAFLLGADMDRTHLGGANLRSADLGYIRGRHLVLEGAHLEGAMLDHVDLVDAKLGDAYLAQCNLGGSVFNRSDFSQADMTEANLEGLSAVRSKFHKTNLLGANLKKSDLSQTIATGAVFSHADLTGATLTQANINHSFFWDANLSGANLMLADLGDSILKRANMEQANLSQAILVGSDLRMAKLVEAELLGTKMSNANAEGVDLSGANLNVSELKGTNFRYARLVGANMDQAWMDECDLRGSDLFMVKGLTLAQLEVSLIDCDTIFPDGESATADAYGALLVQLCEGR